jgi:ABC-type xylose transport system substrate-binding protein
MGVHEGRGTLTRAMKDLMIRWQQTRGEWDDANARKFESERLVSLEQDLRAAVAAMDTMAILLQQIHRDCE